MAIKINWNDLQKRFVGSTEIVRVYKAGYQVRPDIVPPTPNYLKFTAPGGLGNISLSGSWTATLEISTDGTTWSDYTRWVDIDLDIHYQEIVYVLFE